MLIRYAPLLAVLALAGCAGQGTTRSSSTEKGTSAATADAPKDIIELTVEKQIYECPKCGMMFDRAGMCSMGCAELVATKVDYVCPADDKPVERAGKCPRCAMNARVEKTAMNPALPSSVTGN